MTSQPLDEERIFGFARRLSDAEARSEYLDQICAGDQALRDRVEALLKVYDDEQSFLKSEAPLSPTTDEQATVATVGQQIGRYKLLQKVGEGGFGIVFMAEQTRPVRRKVALKVIKPGMDTRAVVARFEAERQALAMMDHPNIARVFDGGATDGGRPYFVMELVKGVPMTEYCDKNELSTDLRLELFMTVCHAVQHAHQKGIIHRDLKPSNVLVTLADGEPVVKVIDFGVAKATNQQLTEKTLFTAFGQMVGTPQYMSPEQAEMSCLDVDTRSDVYSLGVLLYELLTGTTPLEAERLRTAGYAEMQRLIREEEPPKPSTRLSTSGETLTIIAKHRKVTPEKLKSQVKGDLDWIVMKALEKDRNRRYDTPASFASDIKCYLTNEPVEAYPPSANYRLGKYLRRNRRVIGVATVIAVALVTTSVISSWFAYRFRAEKQRSDSTLSRFRETVFEQGSNHILNADVPKAKQILSQLEQDRDGSELHHRLDAAIRLHDAEFERAIEILEKLAKKHPDDTGLRAMLTDAYDGHGDILRFLRSFDVLSTMNTDELQGVERLYAAFAYIVYPETGYRLARKALLQNPTSHYCRLVKARMAANYANRKGDLTEREKAVFWDQTLEDLDSLKLLYDHDKRIPIQSLAAYLYVANAQLRQQDPRWETTLAAADHVAQYLQQKGPTNWQRFFLSAYFYCRAKSESEYLRAQEMLRDLSLEGHDWGTNHYYAICFELDLAIDTRRDPAVSSLKTPYALYGAGCWLALNDNSSKASAIANQLAERESLDELLLAIDVALLAKDRKAAERFARKIDFPKSVKRWYLKNALSYYIYDLLKEGDCDSEALIRSARESVHAATNLSKAQWSIALTEWSKGSDDCAERFRECVEQRQIEFYQPAWSRAILKRKFSADVNVESVIDDNE